VSVALHELTATAETFKATVEGGRGFITCGEVYENGKIEPLIVWDRSNDTWHSHCCTSYMNGKLQNGIYSTCGIVFEHDKIQMLE